MTKEELIELSDLNREDNIKYISSEAQGIAITLDSDRYAPTLCKLERAYICGRRKSEEQQKIDAEQIRALQKQNGELTDKVKELETLRDNLVSENMDLSKTYQDDVTYLKNKVSKLEAQLEREKNLNQCMSDNNEQLRELIEKMKCLNEEIIKTLNECLDYEWLHAHNGKAKYLYLQTVIDIVNEKFEEIKENDF